MTEQEITRLGPAFANYLGRYRSCFLQKRTAAHFDTYCRGLLSDLPRKSVEPITLEAGTAHYGLGYTGNGVGPAHLGGRILAHRALGRFADILELPLVDLEPMRFPPEPIRSPGALIANHAIRRKDDFEDRGEEPNPLVDFVARLPRRLGYHLGP